MKKFFQTNVNTIKCKHITIVYQEILVSVALMIQEHYDNVDYDDTLFLVNTANSTVDLQGPEYNQHRCIYYNLEHSDDFDNEQKEQALQILRNYKVTEVWSMEPNCEIWDSDLGVKYMPVRYTSYLKNNSVKQPYKFDLGFVGLPVNANHAPRRINLIDNLYFNTDIDISLKILGGYTINELCDELSNCKFVLDTHRNYRHNMQNQVRIFEHICLGHTVLSEKSDYNLFPGLIYEFENVDQLNDLVHTIEPQDFSEKYKEMTYSDEAYEAYRNAILYECYHKWAVQYFDEFGIKRYDLINRLIKKFNYTNYLEIGVSKGDNFIKIDCENKTSVDPEQFGYTTHQMTSDEFFTQLPDDAKFDIIFIDGLHLWEQCYKDIENSLKHLTPNGIIVCHDMNPLYEMYNSRKPYNACIWNGDVWKAFVKIRTERVDIFTCMIEDCDFGLGFICFGEQPLLVLDKPFEKLSFTDDFSKNKHYLMNSIKINDFFEKTNI